MKFEEKFSVSDFKESMQGFAMRFEEKYDSQLRIHGHVWAELKHQDGLVEKINIGRNIIVVPAGVLVARLLANKSEPKWGLKYLAVGTGDPGWPPANPPSPTGSETGLVAELTRKTFSSINFINPITGAITTTPTNVVDYVTIFDQTEAVGGLMEMGLVGGDAIATPVAYANGGKNTDTFLNARRFAVIYKPATSTLTFTWRITT